MMQHLREFFFGKPSYGLGQYCCFDNQYRPTYHGSEQRYVSPTTGRCRPLVVQAVHPKIANLERQEVLLGGNTPRFRKLAIWLVLHPPFKLEEVPVWLARWTWFTLVLVWPFTVPKYTGVYPAYLSKYRGQLWVARSPREYCLRSERLGEEPVRETAHSPYPRRLVIYDSASGSWKICDDRNIINQQKYVAISYRYNDVVPEGVEDAVRKDLQKAYIAKVEAVLRSLGESAYWIDLTLVEETTRETIRVTSKDLYLMADVYRSAEFTLIMFSPPKGATESEAEAWKGYGERLWTLPEALLSRRLRYKFRDGDVTPITLHQLAIRAYANLDAESAVINSYAGIDPLERLEKLSMLKASLWKRRSRRLDQLEQNNNAEQIFRADRVYALMGFFEHRIYPHFEETELQAFVRLSMANDNDRLVERMVSLLPSTTKLPHLPSWFAETDEWGSNLWDIEPEVQVVGMTESHALVLGGCRAATIRWKDFPAVAFATRRSYKRLIASFLPNLFWELLFMGIVFEAENGPSSRTAGSSQVPFPWAPALLVIAIILMLFAPLLVAYGGSGRIVLAQPWLIGVKGIISAEEASELMYGGAIFALPRTFYTASGTRLAQTERGPFRRGDPAQVEALRPRSITMPVDDNLYTLIDTFSATIYYFRAARPPTVCLYLGRESGMGRFALCSERCTTNELHKETVIRMPWYISQSMRACDWIALC